MRTWEESRAKYVDVDLARDVQKKLDAAGTIQEKRRIALQHIMDNLRGKYATNDGRTVEVNRRSANELTFGAPEIRLRAVPELENIIKTGNLKEIKPAEYGIFENFAYYEAMIKIGDDYYSALINIGVKQDGGSFMYQINKFEKRDAPARHWQDQKFVTAGEGANPPNHKITHPDPNVNT
jgi:hypothetical protein